MTSVQPGNTLEQRLKDPGYKNWLKAGMCLIRVKEGLETFVDAESKVLHQSILAKYKPCGHCTQDGLRCKNNKKLCSYCFLFQYEIEISHKYRKPYWDNTDVQKWPHDHWSVAKCFMNPGQLGNNLASDTDVSGLLNFIIHCNKFHDLRYGDIQKNAENVREDRNHLIHRVHDQLSDADLKSIANDMLKLLMDENPDGRLKGNKEAERAKMQIQEVLKENFVILLEDEYTVKLDALEGRMDHLNEELQQVKQGEVIQGQEIGKTAEEVRDLEKKYEQLKAKIDKIQEDHHEVQTLKASLQVQDTIIKNLSERVESKFSFITQQIKDKLDEMHTHIEELKFKVAHLEAVTRDHGEKLEVLYTRVPKEDEISDKGLGRKRKLTDDQEGLASKRIPSYQREIDHLQEDLKSCYKSLSTVPISAFNEEETIPLETFYVDMDITLEHQTKDRNTVKLSSYKQIFSERRNQRIILTGLSGSGKSTFCRKIVNTWCMEEAKKKNETNEETDPFIFDNQRAIIDKNEKGQLVPESCAAIGDQTNELSICSSCEASTDEETDSPVSDRSEFVINWESHSSVADSSEAIEDQDILLQFLLLFYIYAPKISTEQTLTEVLYNQCLRRESDQLSKILQDEPGKILIILDGIDEMGNNIPPFLSDLLARILHPRIIVLMAMRPWKISQLRLKPLSHYDLLLEVQGLSEISALKFIQNVINVNKTYMTVESHTGSPALEEEDVLSSLRNIPILVLFLTHIWCQDQCLPKRRHELYTKILECLIKRCLNKTGNKYTPALTDQDDIDMKKEQFWELYINGVCQAAHDFLLKGVSGPSVVMQEKDLMNKLGTNAQLKLGALLDCGILSKQDAFSPLEKKVSVTFLHLSIHEFLTSKHLANNDVAFQNFLTSLKTLNDVFRYENLLIFIYGHDAKKGHEAFTRICQVCDEDPLVIQYRQEMDYNYDLEITDSMENLMEVYRAFINEMDNEERIEISDVYFISEDTVEIQRLRSCNVKSLYLRDIELDLDSLYCMTKLTSLKLDDVQLLGGVLELSKLSNLTSLTMNEVNEPYSVHDLRSLTKLTFLKLFNITMSDGVLDLSCLINLTSLTLWNVTIPDGVLDLSRQTNLTFLSLSGNAVHGLSSLTNLTTIELSNVTMPDGVLDLSSLINLTSLALEQLTLSEECSSISFCTHLETLELRYITLDDGVLDLRHLINQTSLTLWDVAMSEKCSRALCSSISGWTHLQSLELFNTKLHDGVLELCRLTKLSTLTLQSVTMSKECCGSLCRGIICCIHLQYLKLVSIMLHDGVLDLNSLTNLSSLTLECVTMSEECTHYLCSSISSCAHLEHIEWKGITLYEGVLYLNSLTNLNSLTLHDVTMYEASTRYLCSSISFCIHLERLDLKGMTLHEGALDLSNLTHLTFLKLNNVTMSEECSRTLCTSISACTHLESLLLLHIRLQDGVLDLTGLSGLAMLWIFDVTISAQCKQTLQKSLKQGRKREWKVQNCRVEGCRSKKK